MRCWSKPELTWATRIVGFDKGLVIIIYFKISLVEFIAATKKANDPIFIQL